MTPYTRYATVTKTNNPDIGDHWLVTAYIGYQHGTAIYFNEQDATDRAYKFVGNQESLYYFD